MKTKNIIKLVNVLIDVTKASNIKEEKRNQLVGLLRNYIDLIRNDVSINSQDQSQKDYEKKVAEDFAHTVLQSNSPLQILKTDYQKSKEDYFYQKRMIEKERKQRADQKQLADLKSKIGGLGLGSQ
jgi:predicted ATPase with chaperone activity